MAKTKIAWADKVWNPVSGCTKISEGCQNCYAERMHTRLEKIENSGYCDGKPHFSVRLHPERLEEPLKWKKPQRVFVCSMGDLFHKDVPIGWTGAVLDMIAMSPQHTYMVLTKRPARMKRFFEIYYHNDVVRIATAECWVEKQKPLSNLWLGVSVENQQAAEERIPVLLHIPAAKRFISIEPMLGLVDFTSVWWNAMDKLPGYPSLSWVILGGETGPKARPMHPDWVRSVRDQCQAAGVPFFFKQWGEWAEVGASGVHPGDICMSDDGFIDVADKNYVCFANESEGVHLRRVGKRAAGHLLDGKEYREWPE